MRMNHQRATSLIAGKINKSVSVKMCAKMFMCLFHQPVSNPLLVINSCKGTYSNFEEESLSCCLGGSRMHGLHGLGCAA